MGMDFTLPALTPARNQHSFSYEPAQLIAPKRISQVNGNVEQSDSLVGLTIVPHDAISKSSCVLTKSSESDTDPSIILDFEYAVAGLPIIHVTGIDDTGKPAHLQMSFSEGYPGILRLDGDGPFPFSAGADTMRRTVFRISNCGYHEARNVQGSERWAKITLTTVGRLSLSFAGFKPITSNIPVDELPGSFQCSDKDLTNLWRYGARTLQLNCVPARSVPPPWQVSEDMGVLIDSQRCNCYGWGGDWTDYDFEVEGMIIHGGLSWTVRQDRIHPGLLFIMTETSIELWYGFYNVSQITLVPQLLSKKPVSIQPGKWLRISTKCKGTEPIEVRVNGIKVGKFEQGKSDMDGFLSKDGEIPQTPRGSVGIGAGQDQVCRFRNLSVTSIPEGTVLYHSGLNNTSVLSDFAIGWNQFPYVMDGAKRDRYAWTADLVTGGHSVYYSTAGAEYVRGNIEASMLRNSNGLLPGGTPLGRAFERGPNDTMFEVLTVNYSLYLILVIYDYWMFTGDQGLIDRYRAKLERCVEYITERINSDGLVELYGRDAWDYDYYNGQREGVCTKTNALFAISLRSLATMLPDKTTDYEAQASAIIEAINEHLYDSEKQQFVTTKKSTGIAQEMHSWLIYQKLIPRSMHAPILSTLQQQLGTPPMSFSKDAGTPDVVSPIMSAFHILAAIEAGDHQDAERVLRSVFCPMYNKSSEHFTGTCWEFLNMDGTPYKDQFCSYAQLFSVGPTFILSRYTLGVEPTIAGFKEFKVHPRFEIKGVDWAQGRVPTPSGETIDVKWQNFEHGWRLHCKAPRGLVGHVFIPESISKKIKALTVNEKEISMKEYFIVGGENGESIDIVARF